jgi:hypothetical protein
VPVPLIDSVAAGCEWALEAVRSNAPRGATGFGVAWQNVSWELEALR